MASVILADNGSVSGSAGIKSSADSSGVLALATGSGTTAVTIDASQNVGLGVTPSANSIAKAFELQTGFNIFGYANLGYINANAYYNGGWLYKNTDVAGRYEVGGAHKWFNAPSGTAGNAITFTQAMTLDASGNLGVGTTSPVARADIISNTTYQLHLATTTGNYSSAGIYLGALGTSDPGYYGYVTYDQTTETLRLGNRSSSAIGGVVFYTAQGTPVERARIDSNGNFLVGTPSNAYANANSVLAVVSTAGQVIVQHASGSGSGSSYCDFTYNATRVGNISQSGTTNVLYNVASDYRLKNNQAPLTGSGAFIDALQPKTWDWAQDGSKGAGFIAHEFAEVSPNSVVGEKDAVDADGKPVYQAMQASSPEVIANLVAEIQSLRKRLAALEGTK